jgi:hypothetical protein
VAGRPLSPATRRCLGRLLPYQLADGTWADPGPAGPRRDPRPLTARRCLRVVSSSITPPFGGLSSCPGYVAHALLTLPPRYWLPEGSVRARLAWVSHAASVRSEPGSNPSFEILIRPRAEQRARSSSRKVIPAIRAGSHRPGAVSCRPFRDRAEGLTQNPCCFPEEAITRILRRLFAGPATAVIVAAGQAQPRDGCTVHLSKSRTSTGPITCRVQFDCR